MATSSPRLAMVAGEASGDLLAGMLLGALKQRWPSLQAYGVGGPAMARHGFDAWWPHHKLAVLGYVEALKHYRELLKIRNDLRVRMLRERPDAFIGVDAPDFNMGLERALKDRGIKVIHFVSPSVWAWRRGRIDKIRRSVDHMLCLFPFEPAIYRDAGIAATYVGHPLADAIPLEPPRAQGRTALGVAEDEIVVALLPGSRRAEVAHIGPALLGAAAELQRRRPALRFVLPVAPGLSAQVEPLVAAHAPNARLQLLDGRSHEALAACDVALVASGTATLEAALFKRPMVIAYRMHALQWQLMKRMGYQPWVGLPNILLRDFVVPELLQAAATPAKLADATEAWLDDPARRADVARRFEDLHRELRRNTAQAATDAIEDILA